MLSLQKALIIGGVFLILIGLLLPWLLKLKIGSLPGDILIKKDNFSFYFPITTTIILSLLLSIILWLFNR